MAIGITIISAIILVKYKPGYVVLQNGEQIGYVSNKNNFQKMIDNEILEPDEENVAFVSLDEVSYKFEFVTRGILNETEAFEKIKENSKKIYKVYEVANSDDTNAVYVNSFEEAENLTNTLKEQYNEIEPDLKITTLYLESEASEESINEAKTKITEDLENKLEEKKELDSKTINGICLACIPVSGTISSRFGSVESIRDHVHGGLDIAARYGTDIKAVASGTIKSAGWCSGYGNLVIIDHGNGVETYYGHCSKLYVKEGQTVNAGDVISAVGSTGNSTGNHLHFEIRVNGTRINPQNYLYK